MTALRWQRHDPVRGGMAPPRAHYTSGDWAVWPTYERGRGGRRLRRVVYRLTYHRRQLGALFHTAWLAKRFAAEYQAADAVQRRVLLRDGAQLCAQWERERRQRHAALERARWAREGVL